MDLEMLIHNTGTWWSVPQHKCVSHPPEVVPVDSAVGPGRNVEDWIVFAPRVLALNAVNLNETKYVDVHVRF